MKALGAELAVELVGGVVSVGAARLTLRARWEIWSAEGHGAAGTLPAPTLRQSVMGRKVSEANPRTELLRRPLDI